MGLDWGRNGWPGGGYGCEDVCRKEGRKEGKFDKGRSKTGTKIGLRK